MIIGWDYLDLILELALETTPDDFTLTRLQPICH